MLAFDDDLLAAQVQDLLNFDQFEKTGQWKNGWHGALPGRMSNLNASLARVQLDRMEEFCRRRRKIAELYNARLRKVPHLKLMDLTPEHSVYRYIVRTELPSEEISRSLRQAGIDARTSVNPWLDRVPSTMGQVEGGPWPVAEVWRHHLLSLPIYPSMSDEEAILIAESLQKVSGGC